MRLRGRGLFGEVGIGSRSRRSGRRRLLGERVEAEPALEFREALGAELGRALREVLVDGAVLEREIVETLRRLGEVIGHALAVALVLGARAVVRGALLRERELERARLPRAGAADAPEREAERSGRHCRDRDPQAGGCRE